MASGDRTVALKALNTVATELKTFDTPESVCQRTIEAAEEILEFDICVINLEEDGYLPIIAISSSTPPDGATTMTVEEGLAGKTYRDGETILVDDVDGHPDAKPQGPYGSVLSVPIGGHGVFQTVSEETDAFNETDRELAELLVAHCAATLDRIEQAEQLRERTRRLEQQNERLEEFANVVSHDLRNPLNVLSGRLELIRETGSLEHLDDCDVAIDRMESLIADLLRLAREGETVSEPEPVAVGDLARSCWRTVETGDATLSVSGPIRISADPDRLRQVLENLFRNAVEHGSTSDPTGVGDGGEHDTAGSRAKSDEADDDAVRIRVGALPDGEGFYVADDGPGIPVENREEVFDPGFTTDPRGIGFGLSIVERIAEAYGWDVRVTDAEGGGARFEFSGVERPSE